MVERQKYHLLSQKILSPEDRSKIFDVLRGAYITYLPDGNKDYPKKEEDNYLYTLGCSLLTLEEKEYLTRKLLLEIRVVEKKVNYERLEQSVQNTEKTIERLHDARKLKPGTLQQEIDL